MTGLWWLVAAWALLAASVCLLVAAAARASRDRRPEPTGRLLCACCRRGAR